MQVCGLPVVDTRIARQAGIVGDIVIEPSTGRVAAIDLKHGDGWLGDRVPVDFIVRLGPGTVLVTNSRELEFAPPDELDEQRVRARRLIGGQVLTESGERVGKISDILLDPDTMVVTSYELSGSPLRRLFGDDGIKPEEVVSCSNELMIVRDRPEKGAAVTELAETAAVES